MHDKIENLKKQKILFVEDEENLRQIISDTFTKIGVEFDTASNGLEGFEMIKNGEYDLVVTDINMPLMNGLDMVEKVKNELHFDIPVFIMSAHTCKEYTEKAQELGVQNYMMKPFDFINFINLATK